MTPSPELAIELIEQELEAVTVKFATLMADVPIDQRRVVIHQMIGAGAALISAAIASSPSPPDVRKQVEAALGDLIDTSLKVHALATHTSQEPMQ